MAAARTARTKEEADPRAHRRDRAAPVRRARIRGRHRGGGRRAADVVRAEFYDYFPTKEDLVYWRLGAFGGRAAQAVRDASRASRRWRPSGAGPAPPGGLLGRGDPEPRPIALARTIVESPALRGREQQIFAQLHRLARRADRRRDRRAPRRHPALGHGERPARCRPRPDRLRPGAHPRRRGERRDLPRRPRSGRGRARRRRGRRRRRPDQRREQEALNADADGGGGGPPGRRVRARRASSSQVTRQAAARQAPGVGKGDHLGEHPLHRQRGPDLDAQERLVRGPGWRRSARRRARPPRRRRGPRRASGGRERKRIRPSTTSKRSVWIGWTCGIGTAPPGRSAKSKASSSPPVLDAVWANVKRSPVTGFRASGPGGSVGSSWGQSRPVDETLHGWIARCHSRAYTLPMDAVGAGLLDGPRARGAFLLRSSMDPPWSLRIEEEAPLTLVAMVRGEAWLPPGRRRPGAARPGRRGHPARAPTPTRWPTTRARPRRS